tara:strand:+ start:784 stop:1065 length:282 start_codon:yes stop_codon:yes gene_type:complete
MTKCYINITPLNVSRETWLFRMILISNKVCKKHIANDQAMQKIAIVNRCEQQSQVANKLSNLIDLIIKMLTMSLMINLKILIIILVNLIKVTT